MNLWNKITSRFNVTQKTTVTKRSELFDQTEEALNEFKKMLVNKDDFIEPQLAEELRSKWSSLYFALEEKNKKF